MRAMNCFVTAGTPARSLTEEAAMIASANQNRARRRLLLEMAFKTKICVALRQHLVVDGPVRVVTNSATLAHRLMLEHERPALRRVTLATHFVVRHQRRPAGNDGRP